MSPPNTAWPRWLPISILSEYGDFRESCDPTSRRALLHSLCETTHMKCYIMLYMKTQQKNSIYPDTYPCSRGPHRCRGSRLVRYKSTFNLIVSAALISAGASRRIPKCFALKIAFKELSRGSLRNRYKIPCSNDRNPTSATRKHTLAFERTHLRRSCSALAFYLGFKLKE